MYGTVADVSARLGEVLVAATPDYNRAAANLFDASVLIDAETGQTWDPPTGAPPIVTLIAIRVAERAFRNPDAVTYQGAGAFTQGFAQNTAKGVFLSEDEKSLLAVLKVGGSEDRSLVSVEMTGEYAMELGALFLQDQYGGDAIRYGGLNDPYLWDGPS
jgi:hypothetical protein